MGGRSGGDATLEMPLAATASFQSILRCSRGRRPLWLQTDKGNEFYNTNFAHWLEQQGIRHFSTQGVFKRTCWSSPLWWTRTTGVDGISLAMTVWEMIAWSSPSSSQSRAKNPVDPEATHGSRTVDDVPVDRMGRHALGRTILQRRPATCHRAW